MSGPRLTRLMQNISLQQRLASLVGHLAEINGPNMGLEPGRLQRVLKNPLIVVKGELFVPASLESIRVFDVKPPKRTIRVGVRTTFSTGSAFNRIRLVRIGTDFIELLAKDKNRSRILLPLNKVEGIYQVK
ncbi:hypothetical protein BBD41_07800 [Paenibacillus ihbetae]|uniref:Uncharacterized protein n=1 Tax=Paenibacillus ihbetae TaxID=1870820 RepID=A0A1B2DXZ0_9BACL|nr:hypothetical protein [Paenibacillus ihbetae]ANY72497.1 hypothetical protein BBD41_07800 [Paenibacillus ihbetae]